MDDYAARAAALKLDEAVNNAFNKAKTDDVTEADILSDEEYSRQEFRAGLAYLPAMVGGLAKLERHRRAVEQFGLKNG